MQDAMIQRLAEKDSQFYGQQISGSLTVAKSAAAGAIRDIKFLDTDTCFWQLTQQQTMQHKAHTADLIPHLGDLPAKCTQHQDFPAMQNHQIAVYCMPLIPARSEYGSISGLLTVSSALSFTHLIHQP